MSRVVVHIALALGLALAAGSGCSDDGGSTPQADGPQTPVEAGVDGPVSDGWTPGGDGQVTTPDAYVPTGCVKECYEFYDYLCVKDPATGYCKACLNDNHCQINPRADGPFCDTVNMMCVCKVAADCADRTTGKLCEKVGDYYMCTCQSDADCPAPYTICEGTLIKRCVKPCTSNADCVKGGFTGFCDTQTGKCEYA